MKVLVIGGAGYIGSHVVQQLLHAGFDPWILDNLSSGRRENIRDSKRFFLADIMESEQLDEVFSQGWDAVVHLAAEKNAGESMLLPEKYARNNISGSIEVLNAMVRHEIPMIVFSSTAAVYGEPQYVPVDEKHPLEPENFYGYTKLQIEGLLNWYAKIHGIRYAALRYFNAAGYAADGSVPALEKSPANLLPVLMETALGWREEVQIFGNDFDTEDGTGIRDYVHVSDLARAHVLSLRKLLEAPGESPGNITVNLGSRRGISVLQMLEVARRITAHPIPATIVARRPGDPARVVASSDLAQQLLGWEATESDLDSLVRSSWNIYRQQQSPPGQ